MPVVDVTFPLQVATVPRDHGYILYGAISRVAPSLHTAAWLGIHPLSGRPVDETLLELRHPQLRLRVPAERIPDILPLSGATIDLAGRPAVVGVPTIHPLTPSASLDARMVAIKLTDAPRRDNEVLGRASVDVAMFQKRYVAEIERQLAKLEIRRPFSIRGRRELAVAGRRVIGFSVRVTNLDADESLRLMEHGIGGKRRMGCGIFRATRAL